MRIGELSKETGVSERALRHYEEKGILPLKRLENGYRDFDESAIEKSRAYSNVLTNRLKLRRDRTGMLRCLEIEPHLTKTHVAISCTLRIQTMMKLRNKSTLLSNIQTNLQKHVSLLKQAKEKG